MGAIMNPWVGMTDILGSANSTSHRVVKYILSETLCLWSISTKCVFTEAMKQFYNLLIPCGHWLVCAPGWGFWICKVSKLGWSWDGPSSYKRCSNTLRALVSAHAGAVRPQNCPICLLSRLLCWSAIIGGTNPNHCCATNSGQFGHLDLCEIANHEHLSVADFPVVSWGIHHGTQSVE